MNFWLKSLNSGVESTVIIFSGLNSIKIFQGLVNSLLADFQGFLEWTPKWTPKYLLKFRVALDFRENFKKTNCKTCRWAIHS